MKLVLPLLILVLASNACRGSRVSHETKAAERSSSESAAPAASPGASTDVGQTLTEETLSDYFSRAWAVQIERGTTIVSVTDMAEIRALLRLLGERQIVDTNDRGVKCRSGLPLLRFRGPDNELGDLVFCSNVGLGDAWVRPVHAPGGRIKVRDPQGLKSWLEHHGA